MKRISEKLLRKLKHSKWLDHVIGQYLNESCPPFSPAILFFKDHDSHITVIRSIGKVSPALLDALMKLKGLEIKMNQFIHYQDYKAISPPTPSGSRLVSGCSLKPEQLKKGGTRAIKGYSMSLS